MAVLDTTILVDLLRRRSAKHQDAQKKLDELGKRRVFLLTTRFNIAELYLGIELSDNPGRDRLEVELLLSGIQILDFDDKAANVFAQIRAHQRRSGLISGDFDTLIAATAVANGETIIVTRNVSDFANATSILVEDY